jgi:trehalose 6-phosphate phosphatase
VTQLPSPGTAEGRAGLEALLAGPRRALLATDFDGTLAPIVADPRAARPLPGAVPALRQLAAALGTVAVITGRPAPEAVSCGGLDAVPGLIVLGHYGRQRWQDGQLSGPASPPAVQAAREALPGLLAAAGPPDGLWVEDKGHAVAVHTRRTADPAATLAALRGPLGDLAERLGLAAEAGRMVIELRPPGMDKGAALTGLARERRARAIVFCGDDLGDLPAFTALRELRGRGVPGCAVASASAESPQVEAEADLVVAGPAGIVALLAGLAAELAHRSSEAS